jgi:hypothetical protein
MLKLLLATPDCSRNGTSCSDGRLWGTQRLSSMAPLPAAEIPEPVESAPEQARDFHFAVTWVTLFAHLDPIEAAGPRPRVETPSPTLALVPVVAPRPEQHASQDSSAAWEMVVPKMIRTGAANLPPRRNGASKKPGAFMIAQSSNIIEISSSPAFSRRSTPPWPCAPPAVWRRLCERSPIPTNTIRTSTPFAARLSLIGPLSRRGVELLRRGPFGTRQRRCALQSGSLPATLGSLGCILPGFRTRLVARSRSRRSPPGLGRQLAVSESPGRSARRLPAVFVRAQRAGFVRKGGRVATAASIR